MGAAGLEGEEAMSTWATPYIEKLRRGETVQFRPHGNSMEPLVRSGALCTVEPVDPCALRVGDVVLCRVGRDDYLHRVVDLTHDWGVHSGTKTTAKIGNNKGRINGTVDGSQIYGKLVKVEP